MDFVIELPDELTRAVVTDASAAVYKLIQLDDTITRHPSFWIRARSSRATRTSSS